MCPDCGRELMRPKIFVFGVAKDILEAYSPMQRRLVQNHIVSIIAQPFRPSHMVSAKNNFHKKEKLDVKCGCNSSCFCNNFYGYTMWWEFFTVNVIEFISGFVIVPGPELDSIQEGEGNNLFL